MYSLERALATIGKKIALFRAFKFADSLNNLFAKSQSFGSGYFQRRWKFTKSAANYKNTARKSLYRTICNQPAKLYIHSISCAAAKQLSSGELPIGPYFSDQVSDSCG
jgi:hypothetical protein